MKIRTGFVSNSSSSSFCIYGYKIETMTDEWKQFCSAFGIDPDTVSNSFNIRVDMKKLPEEFEIECGPDGYYLVLGKEWKNIGDDETGLIFRENVKRQIEEFVGYSVICRTYEDAWYDG